MSDLIEACKEARDWFDRFANDEKPWEDQPAADLATILTEAIRKTIPKDNSWDQTITFNLKDYVDYVNQAGLKCDKGKRGAFVAGACCLFLLLGMGNNIPATWILNPAFGRDPFESNSEEEKE